MQCLLFSFCLILIRKFKSNVLINFVMKMLFGAGRGQSWKVNRKNLILGELI